MTPAARIRARNTARVQVAAAMGCLVVAAFLLYVDTLPGEMTGLLGALVVLALLAAWMFRRGWRGLRRAAEPTD
jgi:O-antigen/teichoic acid export membrane protein